MGFEAALWASMSVLEGVLLGVCGVEKSQFLYIVMRN